MITKLLTRDISLILAASFFYMACPMMVTPLIAGFSESLGASAVLMGLVGGMMNVVSLCCRPFVGQSLLTRSANIAFRPLARC